MCVSVLPLALKLCVVCFLFVYFYNDLESSLTKSYIFFFFFSRFFFFVLTAYISRLYLIKRGEVGNLICGREHINFFFIFIFCFSRATWLLNQKQSLFFCFLCVLYHFLRSPFVLSTALHRSSRISGDFA